MALRSPFNQSELGPVPEQSTYFDCFGLAPCLALDLNALQTEFYRLSRLTHPDKFALASTQQQLLAARWSTWINRAYQTLRDPILRAQYLMELSGLTPPENDRSVPLELAEQYFDLQDLLQEPGGIEKLQAFRKDLESRQNAWQTEWAALELEWEAAADRKKLLERLAKHLTLRRFLLSMTADIDRKLSR